jgi:hypothetical protein
LKKFLAWFSIFAHIAYYAVNIRRIPVAVRFKASVYGRSHADIVGPNPSGIMDVCLL